MANPQRLAANVIYIPNTVTSLKKCCFANFRNLRTANIPNSVTQIGNGSFTDTISTTSCITPNSDTNIQKEAFCAPVLKHLTYQTLYYLWGRDRSFDVRVSSL